MDIYKLAKTKAHSEFYLNRYFKFIEYCKNTNKDKPFEYGEKHHILPKAKDMFESYSNCSWNIVELTGRQHFIAHLILHKTYDTYSTAISIFNFRNRHSKNSNITESYFKLTSKQYEKLKIERSKKLSKLYKGSKFYNNGTEQRMFFEEEVPDGWVKGRLNKPWNKNLQGAQEAWNKNLQGAQEAWNKGKTKDTCDIMKKISNKVSNSLSGLKQSTETIEKRKASLKSYHENKKK